MNPDRWKQIDELFDAALDLPETARAAFLDERCGDDADLKREVLSLLAAGAESADFLDESAMGVVAKNLAGEQRLTGETDFRGRRIGTYRIEKMLGAGGMGEVYLATDEKLKRRVALKILPAEYTSNDERVKRFQLEARAISALNHPNIVTVYDVGDADGLNFIATEYVEGLTLRDFAETKPRLKDVLGAIAQVCDALAAAHGAGIIHRDIKPENIMVRPDGYVKILDFGLAKLTDIDLNTLKNFSGTAKGIIIGTPAYMSPEQVADDNVDHRTDLWSVGVVLYELLTGVNPYKKENRQATFQAILAEAPPPPSAFNPEITPELDAVLAKALEKDADLSYQNAADIRADLKRIRREIDSSPSWSRSGRVLPQRREGAKARRWIGVGFLGLAVLVLAGSLFLLYKLTVKKSVSGTDWSKAKNVQLTDSLAVESYPSLAPDGQSLLFSMVQEGNEDIFWQRIGGKNPVNLTANSKAGDSMPAFSPDGRLIAFRSERSPGGIYLMEATGENVRRLADTGFHPTWSPDGKRIAVSDRPSIHHTLHTLPNSSLSVIDVETGARQPLDTRGDAIMPSWSPHGNRIAYWFVREGRPGEIATVPAGGGEPVAVTDDDFSDWNPVWSPDGRFLYFASDRGGSMSLWRIAVDEETGRALGEPESVATPAKYCRHITFSRDGSRLGYIRYESKSNLQTVGFDPQTEKLAGEIDWVTRGNHEITNPHLAPDGEHYLIRSVKPAQEDLVVFDKTGENWRNLTNDRFLERIPSWSHDGRRIVFHSDRSGKYQIWTIDADGANLRQITFSEKTGAFVGVFSPDDTKLVFSEIDGKNYRPFLLDLAKPWAEQMPQPLNVEENSYAWVGGWSADGQKLLLLTFKADGSVASLGVYDFRTNAFEKMTDHGSSPVWLADNRHFLFTDTNGVFLCDTETKKIAELFKPPAYEIQGTNISPDNKFLYFRYLQVDADVWLIDSTQ
ncbi:MAG: PD40 domain-containing protein [Acidobacteria bacterium]|nr:PD40 domain-containing protein [Acidobacteriota bacterium]